MLNIDDRLITEVSAKIGPNALSVLMAIGIHMNQKTGCSFPSHDRLMKLTGLGRDAVYSALTKLKSNNLLESKQNVNSKKKTFGGRIFIVTTDFVKIFINVDSKQPVPESPYTDHPETGRPEPGLPETETQETKQIKSKEQIKDKEQIKKERGRAPAKIENLPIKTTAQSGDIPAGGENSTGAWPEISFDDRPSVKTATELVAAMRSFYDQYPREWDVGVIESAKAGAYNHGRRVDIVTAWAAHTIKSGHGGDTYQVLNAGLQAWFIRQREFDHAKSSPTQPESTTRLRPIKTA